MPEKKPPRTFGVTTGKWGGCTIVLACFINHHHHEAEGRFLDNFVRFSLDHPAVNAMGAAASAHAAHNRRSEDGSLDQWHTQPPADSTTAALAELERAAGGGAPARVKMIKVVFPEGPMGLVLTQSEVGLSVTSVEGAAEAAGVEPMDVVCELNGRRIGADLETGERRRTLASLGAERARALSLSLSLPLSLSLSLSHIHHRFTHTGHTCGANFEFAPASDEDSFTVFTETDWHF